MESPFLKDLSNPIIHQISKTENQISTSEYNSLENFPPDWMIKIALELDAQSLKNLCLTSKKLANVFSKENEIFWLMKLDFDFPVRIQKTSSKMGSKRYFYWLSDAFDGKIDMGREIIFSKLIYFFQFQKIKLYGKKYEVVEFDSVGYYPDYFVRLKNLDDDKFETLLIYDCSGLMIELKDEQSEINIQTESFNDFRDKNEDTILCCNFISETVYPFRPVGVIKEFEISWGSNFFIFYEEVDEYHAKNFDEIGQNFKIFELVRYRNPRCHIKIYLDSSFSYRTSKVPIYIDSKFLGVIPEDYDEIKKIVDILMLSFPEHIGKIRKWIRNRFWEKFPNSFTREKGAEILKEIGWI